MIETSLKITDNPTDKMADSESLQCVLCRSHKLNVAFRICDVKELVAASELSISSLPALKLPNVGLIRRNGELISVSELSHILGTDAALASGSLSRLVICHLQSDGETSVFGLMVDEVLAVTDIEASAFKSVSLHSVEGGLSVSGVEQAGRIFSKIFDFSDSEYRLVDVKVLHSFLESAISRRKSGQ